MPTKKKRKRTFSKRELQKLRGDRRYLDRLKKKKTKKRR